MARVVINLHTVVQHSGHGYANKPEFRQGLEPRNVSTAANRDKVKKVGGLLFRTYIDADDYAFHEMYDGHDSLDPQAPGEFAREGVDDLRIYIPKRKDHISFDEDGVVKEVKYGTSDGDTEVSA